MKTSKPQRWIVGREMWFRYRSDSAFRRGLYFGFENGQRVFDTGNDKVYCDPKSWEILTPAEHAKVEAREAAWKRWVVLENLVQPFLRRSIREVDEAMVEKLEAAVKALGLEDEA